MKMTILHSELNVLVVVLLLPRFVGGFAFVFAPLVHHRRHHQQQQQQNSFDVLFKARRKYKFHPCYGNKFFDAHRFNRQGKSGSELSLHFFSSKIPGLPPGGQDGETSIAPNRTTLSGKHNDALQETNRNFTNDTNFTNNTNTNTNKTSSRGSGLGFYFPFLDQSQSISLKKTPTVATVDTRNNSNNRNNNSKSATTLLNKEANETITVADLEVLLAQIKTDSNSGATPDRREALSTKRSSPSNGFVSAKATTSTTSPASVSSSSSSSSQVAFPQLSEVTETEIRRSAAFTGSVLGLVIGTTILPNLWLVGMVAGVLYGYEITKDFSVDKKKNVLANFLISSATQLAKAHRKLMDGMKALWFLYKTGQLSYEYYKSYETLDQKFALQQKVDAWNKVFVKGKQKFDAWEQQNEVGRKVLAGLRTAWLVEEESRMRANGRSRYRLVQSAYDLRRSANKLLKKAVASTRSLFDEGGIHTFWKGLRTDLWKEGSRNARLGAIGAAVVTVNVCGALFSLSAGFSNGLAILAALVWPSWTTDLAAKTREIWLDIQSRGSSGGSRSPSRGSNLNPNNPFECLRQKYEDYSRDRVRQSRENQRAYRKRKKRKPPNRQQSNQKTTSASWLSGFGDWQKGKRNGRRGKAPEVGTWGNFKRTR